MRVNGVKALVMNEVKSAVGRVKGNTFVITMSLFHQDLTSFKKFLSKIDEKGHLQHKH